MTTRASVWTLVPTSLLRARARVWSGERPGSSGASYSALMRRILIPLALVLGLAGCGAGATTSIQSSTTTLTPVASTRGTEQ